MAVTSTELLRFILSLLGDPSKAEAFSSDPTGALASAGLGNVTCADIDAITPVIANAAQGAIAIAGIGSTPGEMVQHIVKNVAVSTFENNGVLQNIWTAGDVQQAFAGNGGLAMGGNLLTDAPIVTGDRNIVATDTAQASGRDTIQNQSDGNLALGGDQTIAQDNGVVAGGDAIAQGDKAGGNNNKAENTGNDNSVGGNQNSAENTGNDNSVGGNQNSAENTGNDNSVTSGDTTTNTVDDHSTTVGGNQNSASNTGNDNSVTSGDVVTDNSVSSGDVTVVSVEDSSVGGDYWENGSNVGGIGNDSSVTSGDVVTDNSVTSGDVVTDNSVTSGDVVTDNSVTSGDVVTDNSVSSGDVTVVSVEDSSVGGDYWENGSNVGGIGNDSSVTSGDVVTDNSVSSGDTTDITVDDSSVGGDYWESGSNVGGIGNDSSVTSGDSAYTNVEDSSVGGDYWENGSNDVGAAASASGHRSSGSSLDPANTITLTQRSDESVNTSRLTIEISGREQSENVDSVSAPTTEGQVDPTSDTGGTDPTADQATTSIDGSAPTDPSFVASELASDLPATATEPYDEAPVSGVEQNSDAYGYEGYSYGYDNQYGTDSGFGDYSTNSSGDGASETNADVG